MLQKTKHKRLTKQVVNYYLNDKIIERLRKIKRWSKVTQYLFDDPMINHTVSLEMIQLCQDITETVINITRTSSCNEVRDLIVYNIMNSMIYQDCLNTKPDNEPIDDHVEQYMIELVDGF